MKGEKIKKGYIVFETGALLIYDDKDESMLKYTIHYKTIRCVNLIGSTSFYFKSGKNGIAFFFKNHNPKNAKKWMDYLMLCRELGDSSKSVIEPIDLSEHVSSLGWKSESLLYRFNYKECIEGKKDTIINEIAHHDWLEEED